MRILRRLALGPLRYGVAGGSHVHSREGVLVCCEKRLEMKGARLRIMAAFMMFWGLTRSMDILPWKALEFHDEA